MVKARAEITLSATVDVKSVHRYYRLQSSTAAAPTVPTSITTLPPSGWLDTEPGYTSELTNDLYTVDLTVFSDDSFAYSNVSKSSSYEAAKEAYNKADANEINLRSMETNIGVVEGEIRSEIKESYMSKDEQEELKNFIATRLTQTKDEFAIEFETLIEAMGISDANSTAEFETIKKYIKFTDGNILLGKDGNELTLEIQNNRISFLDSGSEVAYISDNKLNITDGYFKNSMTVGLFKQKPQSNNTLSCVYVGGETIGN